MNTVSALLCDPQDTHKYFDNDDLVRENAQTMLRAALDEMSVDYFFEAEGKQTPSTDQN